MSLRDDTLAILHYQDFKRFPVVHFGYWPETIEKWRDEGHISTDDAINVYDGSPNETKIS